MWKAFTLVEMIVVLGIVITISALSYNTLYTTLRTQQLVQSTRSFIQEVRSARLQAMNMKRQPGESWVYGIGVDTSEIHSSNRYRVFKYLPEKDAFSGQRPTYFKPYPNIDRPTYRPKFYEEPGDIDYIKGKNPLVFYANTKGWQIASTCFSTSGAPRPFDYVVFATQTGTVYPYVKSTANSNQGELLQCDRLEWKFVAGNSEHKVIINLSQGSDVYMETRSL